MDRRSALVLLAVIGIGVFLAGLELLVTAVALPSILADLADPTGGSAWIQLRKASWIINGYLLVYILTMPIAGRLADIWGARRLFIGALAVFTLGSALAGASQSLDQLIAARLVQAVGGGVLVPVGTAAASHLFGGAARPRALGVVGALTFLGMAAGPVVGAAILASAHPEEAIAAAGMNGTAAAAVLAPAWRWVFYINIPIGLIAMTLAWAAGGDWETPHRAGRIDIAGALLYGVALVVGPARADAPRLDGDRRDGRGSGRGDGRAPRRGRRRVRGRGPARAAGGRPVHRPAPLPERAVQLRGPRLSADRVCVRDRDHRRRGLRRSRAVRRSGPAAAGARCPGRRDRRRRARLRLRGPRRAPPAGRPDRSRAEHRRPPGDGALDAGRRVSRSSRSGSACTGSGSG